jgi:hypothetical protein
MVATYDMCADEAFRTLHQYILDAKASWHELTLKEKSNIATVLQPIALKRVPDKHESLSLTVNVNEDVMRSLIERAERNALIYKELQQEDAVYEVDASKDVAIQGNVTVKDETGVLPPPVTVTTSNSHGAQNLEQ